jgi:hypothetical protein
LKVKNNDTSDLMATNLGLKMTMCGAILLLNRLNINLTKRKLADGGIVTPVLWYHQKAIVEG